MTPPTDTGEPAPSTDRVTRSAARTWLLVAGVSLISTGLAAYEISPASVTPLVQSSLGIDAATAGLIVGVMFGTAVVTSLPAGAILDRVDSRRTVAAVVAVVVVAGVWGWVAGRQGDFRQVIASRVLGGVGYVFVWNAGIDIVSRSVEPSRRATAVGIFTASGPVGFALGQGTGPIIAAAAGWSAVFVVFTGLAALGLVVFWPVSAGTGGTRGEPPTLSEFVAVLRTPAVWLVGSLGFLGYALYLFVNSWGPTYLARELELSLAISGALVAVFPAVGVLARVSSGLLSDRLFGGRRRPLVLGSFLVAAPLLFAFPRLGTLGVLVAVLLVSGFAIQLTLGLSFTYVRELVDANVAATAVAFQTAVGLAGAFVAPIAGGYIVDAAGFDTGFVVAAGLGALGVLIAWRAPEPTG
ncbi:MFS transporter [Halosegnis marinus]|uniref:MFS transporter n=1 Tax=Halosegnis marinus TaxID=3034023 RepID=A0ABD5ZRD8_9EURY|nr:MFS transporter [Halosegnis sp. DT85]